MLLAKQTGAFLVVVCTITLPSERGCCGAYAKWIGPSVCFLSDA